MTASANAGAPAPLLTLTGPASADAGESISVSIDVDSNLISYHNGEGISLDSIVIVGEKLIQEFDVSAVSAPYPLSNISIPTDVVGGYNLWAMAVDSDGNVFESNDLPFPVTPPSGYVEVELLPEDRILDPNDTVQLEAFARYAGGTEVEVTDSSTNTTYAVYPPSADGTVISVTPEGLVTALGNGVATVVASNPDGATSTCSDSIRVRVLPEPSSGLLLASGVAVLLAMSRARRRVGRGTRRHSR
jgi:hypothetical protein